MRSKETIITGAMLILITYTLALSLVGQGLTAGQSTQTLSSTGSIQIQTTNGIGVYQDIQCTTPLTSLSWGTLEPGQSQYITCYIKNEGNNPTTLSMSTSNWSPSTAPSYITLGWNYNLQPINPASSIEMLFTLTVSSGVTGITSFNFEITIVGST